MNGIGFRNMKVFKDRQWFDFKPITLFTGTNNSGKSSVINAMQMLQENLTNFHKTKIDHFINTEFRLKSNQNKHGNIKSFVNRENEKNEFSFGIKENDLTYSFVVKINEGLENYGTVKALVIKNHQTDENLLSIEINNKHPHLSCHYKINYKYFVNNLKIKCINTLELNKCRVQLDDLLTKVNANNAEPKELDKLANELANKFSVYIVVDKVEGIHIDTKESYSEWAYWFSNKPWNGIEHSQNFNELRVLFPEMQNKNTESINMNLYSENEINEDYLTFLENGIFDFNQIFGENIKSKKDFEALITKYYDLDITKSYNALSEDLLTTLSNTYWSIEELYSEEDELFVPINLIQNYLSCHPDFGLVASAIVTNRKNDRYGRKDIDKKNYVADHYLLANKSIDFNNTEIKELESKGFFENILNELNKIIFNTYDHKNEGLNFEKRSSILLKKANEYVFKEIDNNLYNFNLNLNCVYVSSSRFQNKRSYNFNDNSDFTSLLKTIENLKGNTKAVSLRFINKWIKEFEIADELILKPDIDTGDFKAYLRLKNQEFLLADFGLGTNQLLPIIFSLSIHFYNPSDDEIIKRTVVIEEPEANLHPAMQSKLADLFVDAYKTFKVQIIAETHSEYLIRKLQYLVGSNTSELMTNEALIYYFYKPDHQAVLSNQVNQVEKIEIDEFGRLSKEFGSGFFDEADRIALDIFLLKQSQSN